jgi:hypothetical protein
MYAISPLFLRKDISISPYHFSGFETKGEYIMTLFYNTSTPAVFAARYPRRFLKPVHVIEEKGLPLLYIYKNDPKYITRDIDNEKQERIIPPTLVTTDGPEHYEIDLDKRVRITRIELSHAQKGCIADNATFVRFVLDKNSHIPLTQEEIASTTGKVYVWQEHMEKGNIMEFQYPASPAERIEIYPLDPQSCFAQGIVTSISYLPYK